MRVAILAKNDFRSPRFLAESLTRMLTKLGVEFGYFPNALAQLEAMSERSASTRHRFKAIWADLQGITHTLRSFDIIIVSDTIGILGRPQILRPLKQLDKPLLFYEVFAYQGAQFWRDKFGPTAHHVFDGLLTVSGIHDIEPLTDRPIFEIGLDITPQATFLAQRPLTAMIDFPREGYTAARQTQLEALQTLNIPILELRGEYTFSEIEAIYAQVGVAFVAFPEAFGLPIVQIQFQGGYIASPAASWVKRHSLLSNGHVYLEDSDRKSFSNNFLIYGSKDELIEQLISIKNNYDPWAVRQTILQQQPQYIHGNLNALCRALKSCI